MKSPWYVILKHSNRHWAKATNSPHRIFKIISTKSIYMWNFVGPFSVIGMSNLDDTKPLTKKQVTMICQSNIWEPKAVWEYNVCKIVKTVSVPQGQMSYQHILTNCVPCVLFTFLQMDTSFRLSTFNEILSLNWLTHREFPHSKISHAVH